MSRTDRTFLILFLFYCVVLSYLVINTGVVSDDFDGIFRTRGKNLVELLLPKGRIYFLETPVEYYTHIVWYYFFRIDDPTAVNIAKIFYIILSLYLISKFFSIFVDTHTALWASFLFIFFPSHEATVYWFMVQYLTLSFAFYLYAFYLAHRDKLFWAFVMALLGSFISYGSPAIAIALFLLFVLRKDIVKGLVLLVPNIIYSSYYLYIAKVISIGGVAKIPDQIRLASIAKQLVLQVVTFFDAMVGPSLWLKICYSFSQVTVLSIALGIALTALFWKMHRLVWPEIQSGGKGTRRYDRNMIVSLMILTGASFVLFAITGYYPQIAFNLGNRVTIFGSLLIVYLIVLVPMSRIARTLVFALIIFCVLGISDHWKAWSAHQQDVIARVRDNQDLRNYRDTKILYVSGNQYSRFGPMSHIEFFSENFVVCTLFELLFNKGIIVEPLNRRHIYRDGNVVDTKYDRKEKVEGYINVYDSEKDVLFTIPENKITSYIQTLPSEYRHWVQLVRVPWIQNTVFRLMPRLRYAL